MPDPILYEDINQNILLYSTPCLFKTNIVNFSYKYWSLVLIVFQKHDDKYDRKSLRYDSHFDIGLIFGEYKSVVLVVRGEFESALLGSNNNQQIVIMLCALQMYHILCNFLTYTYKQKALFVTYYINNCIESA